MSFLSVGKQSVSGSNIQYTSKNEGATNCMLRYNQISTNNGAVIQINSGHSSYNVEVNFIISSNRSTSAEQINYDKSIGNVQINFGVIGKQNNGSANIQINYVDDCDDDYTIEDIDNRFVICRNFGHKIIEFSRRTALITYEITIGRCTHLSETSKKIIGKKIVYKICVGSYY